MSSDLQGCMRLRRSRQVRRCWWALLCLGGAGALGAQQQTAKIQIDASQRANYAIPRTVFGTFLEPIGNSTYNGLWAELLENPSLEENLWNAGRVAEMIRQRPELVRASQLGLPLPWEPLDPTQGNRYEPRWGDAANSWRSLAVFAVPGRESGIRQQVYLPVQRELKYTGSLFAKHISGPTELEISLRTRGEKARVLAKVQVEANNTQWQKYQFSLAIPEASLRALEPAAFVVSLSGDERVQLDQLSLLPADAEGGLDPDMVRMTKDMHTPLVRFGGNFTSAYHWRDGVGPLDKRVSMLNVAWGIPETNQFGTDEFLHFCQLIGAQPQIALNLGSGTAEEAAEWVRYVDEHWSKHSRLLWELGNELWGEWNTGWPTLEELAARTASYSQAIRKVDPNAQLIATGQDPDHYEKWNAAQLTNPPGTFNFLSTHFVVGMDQVRQAHPTPQRVALDGFALPVGLGRQLQKMQTQINGTAGYQDKVRIAFTEWLWTCCRGRAVSDAPRFDNMGGAVTTGGFLNMLLQHADVVPISDMTGIIEFSGIWKKRGVVFDTPSAYVFGMYAGADIETPVQVTSDAGSYSVEQGVMRLPQIPDVPYLDLVAAVNKAGEKLTLFCVNRHPDQDITARVELKGFNAKAKATVETLGAGSIYDVNDETDPEAITPGRSSISVQGNGSSYTFRRASVTRIEFEK